MAKRKHPTPKVSLRDIGCIRWDGIGYVPVDHWMKNNGGELIIRTIKGYDNKFKFALQYIEPDHLDHTFVESLQRIHAACPEALFIGPVESVAHMGENGIPEALMTTVTAGDAVSLGTMTAHAVWAKPPGGVPEEGIVPQATKEDIIIRIAGKGVVIEGTLDILYAGQCIRAGPYSILGGGYTEVDRHSDFR